MESLTTILNPGVLFFLLGMFAVLVKSNLAIPDSVVKFLSLYLMMAIGFKGGISLHESSLVGDGFIIIGIILGMSALVPAYSYYLLRRKIGIADAAAIGATYGSNSTLTYITAAGFLTSIGVAYEGYMTVALVVMETPAIIIAVIMAQVASKSAGAASRKPSSLVVRESLTDGTLLMLVGSMGIGYLLAVLGTEESPLATFIGGDMFTGMLVFFLLYMGTMVGNKFRELDHFPPMLFAFAVIVPIANAVIAILLSRAFGFAHGDAFLLTILCSSASYIVAPAILKETLPEANPAKFLTMSMGITFPLNIVFGIPAYWWAVQKFV
jgi:hypothetical protein